MKLYKRIILIAFLIFPVVNSFCQNSVNEKTPVSTGKEVSYTLDDRDRMIRIEVKIEEMNKRFDQNDNVWHQILRPIAGCHESYGPSILISLMIRLFIRRFGRLPFTQEHCSTINGTVPKGPKAGNE